jgi:acyl-CoA synthetase (NDP forming)
MVGKGNKSARKGRSKARDIHSKGKQNVRALFEPKSITLIGSSKIVEKVGMASPQLFSDVAYNLQTYFKGRIIIIDIETRPRLVRSDLTILTLPPQRSITWAQRAMEAGTKSIIQLTGGFNQAQSEKYFKIALKHHVRVLGPNTIMGMINTRIGLNTTFERDLMPAVGNISVISQSGGVGAILLDWASLNEIGISKFIFMGDKLDIDDENVLEYLATDPKTRVIAMYIEGIKNGRKFVNLSRKITPRKPIVVLKGGITEQSAERAFSHTRSVAGSNEIFNAAFKDAGIIRVGDIEELFVGSIALANQPPMLGKNVCIVSNVGGPAILAADEIVKNNLELTHLTDSTKRKIKKLYPGIDTLNPIDLIADARADRYRDVLRFVLEDEKVDGVLVINMLKSCYLEPEDTKVIPEVASRYHKPVIDVPAGGEDFIKVANILKGTGIPTYNLPSKGALALRILYEYGQRHHKKIASLK